MVNINNNTVQTLTLSSNDAVTHFPDKLMNSLKKAKEDSLTMKVMMAVSKVFSFEGNELLWQDEFHAGGTLYIDGIKPSNMSKPVMWGVDRWNRPYIALKVHAIDDVNNVGVETLFQRYSDNTNIWTSGKHHLQLKPDACLLYSCMSDKEFEKFNDLINGKVVSYETRFNNNNLVKVKLAE